MAVHALTSAQRKVTTDSNWKYLYRLGGIAALTAIVVFRSNFATELVTFNGFGIFNVPATWPAGAQEWFVLFQHDRLMGLVLFDLFDLVNYGLLALIFLALYSALRRSFGFPCPSPLLSESCGTS